MMITGRIWKDGNEWIAESKTIDVCTQGTSQADACEMLADAIQTLVDHEGFKVKVGKPGADGVVTVEANKPATFAAFVLQRLREQSGKSLADVALAMGKVSRNAFARYEQGEAVPTIEKFVELLQVVAPGFTICVVPREPGIAGFQAVKETAIGRSRAAEGVISYQEISPQFRRARSGKTVVLRPRTARGGRGATVVVNPAPKKNKASAKPATARRARNSQKPALR